MSDDVLPDSIYLRRENVFSHKCTDMLTTERARKIQRPLRLPFDMHIILDDRRGSATGLHAIALLNRDEATSKHSYDLGSVTLIDIESGDSLPNYSRCDQSCVPENSTSTEIDKQSDTTFLLFPAPGESVPIESVACQIKTLVVLDCKWTKSSLYRKNADLSKLRKVHLSKPPTTTFYWRWHNAGVGCVSTIEAIYYAAMEVSEQKFRKSLTLEDQNTSMTDHLADKNNLVHLLWLFGHQRAATFQAAERNGIPAPGSVEGKELQRSLRKQKGDYAWRSERNKEIGKILKEECKRMRELTNKN